MKRPAFLASFCIFGLSACAMNGIDDDATPEIAGAASTELRDAAGRPVGLASITQTETGLRAIITSTALPQGVHGVHLHTTGACQPPDFTSAGPHWNPTGRLHGTQNPQGPHSGDMPNLLVGTDGRGRLEFMIAGRQLEHGEGRLIDRDGGAVVVHAAADDHRTDPSGNSGARIACGVLMPVILR